MESDELLNKTVDFICSKKAEAVEVFDVSCYRADVSYFVVASGNSKRHITSVSGEFCKEVKKKFDISFCVDGEGNDSWIAIDLGNIIVHLMEKEARERYALSDLFLENGAVKVSLSG